VHGSRARDGWSAKQGAWGFKFWEQHAVIVFCFKGGRGALATCGKRNSVKMTLFSFLFFFHSFFFYFNFIFILFIGYPKMGYNNGVARSRGFTSVTHKDREKDRSFEKLSMVVTVD